MHPCPWFKNQGQQLEYVLSPSYTEHTQNSLSIKWPWTQHTDVLRFPSGSEEEAFVFPQSNDTEHNKGTSVWKNNTADSALSDRSTQTDPGVWTPEKKDKRGNHHNSLVHASPDRKVRQGVSPCKAIIQEDRVAWPFLAFYPNFKSHFNAHDLSIEGISMWWETQ